MVLARYLEQGGESSRVLVDAVPYAVRDVLVDEQDGDVLALAGELLEGLFDRRVFCFVVDD